MVVRRIVLRSISTQATDDLKRYLQVLDLGYEDSSAAHQNRAEKEARRVARRSLYAPADLDTPREAESPSRDLSELRQLLCKDLDHLEEQSRSASSQAPTPQLWESLLRRSAAARAPAEGKRLHELLSRSGQLKNNTYLNNLLIRMYASCGSPESSLEVFNTLTPPNVFSWNILISAYAQNDLLLEARSLFDRMPRKNAVSWNTMIVAYVQKGFCEEALSLVHRMDQQPSKITFIHALKACESLNLLEKAEEIHRRITELGWENDVMLSTAIFNVYAKLGELQRARGIFDRMPHRDVVSWNSMVGAYSQRGNVEEAMKLFMRMADLRNSASWNMMITTLVKSGHIKEAYGLFKAMDLEGSEPSRITFLAALSACSTISEARQVHLEIIEAGFVIDNTSGAALINTYGKCGSPEAACLVFEQITRHNSIAWATLVAAFAHNGRGPEAVEVFNVMSLEGFIPNQINFVNVLHACSHGGLLKQGREFFQSMIADYGLDPIFEHYACIVDLLGRTGRTRRAEELIRVMPFEPDAVPWMTLLSACKTHHDFERGASAAEEILRLNPEKCAVYSLFANMHTAHNSLNTDEVTGYESQGWDLVSS